VTQVLDEWIDTVMEKLELEDDFDEDALLDTARVVAHQVERRATPISTYLVGLAVGRGADLNETLQTVNSMAESWSE
jgi:hypothetical protein